MLNRGVLPGKPEAKYRIKVLRWWWNGRHGSLRNYPVTGWGFESLSAHHFERGNMFWIAMLLITTFGLGWLVIKALKQSIYR